MLPRLVTVYLMLVWAAPLVAQDNGDNGGEAAVTAGAWTGSIAAPQATNPWSHHRRVASVGLAASWLATALGSVAMNDAYKGTTIIPVVGPWITFTRIESDPAAGYQPGGKPLLIASGITQVGFLIYYVHAWLNESTYQSGFTVGWNGSSMEAGARLRVPR